MDRIELEGRFVNLCVAIDKCCFSTEEILKRPHIKEQVLRSSCSALLNYGEAQYAQSTKDFIHKLYIVLKELNETKLAFELINHIVPGNTELNRIASELLSLIKIIYCSLKTLREKEKAASKKTKPTKAPYNQGSKTRAQEPKTNNK